MGLSVLILAGRPVIGAVIGYITNDIAIRMLFRPRTEKRIFGWRLPFTPGLIPKEKPRIAASIGKAISENLMNRDVISRTLLSDEMTSRLAASIDRFAAAQALNPEPLGRFLAGYLPEEDIRRIATAVSGNLSAQIAVALASSPLGDRIAGIVVEHVIAKTTRGVGGIIGADRLLSAVAQPVRKLLAKNIDEMLRNNSAEMASTLLDDQIGRLLDTPVRDLLAGHAEQVSELRDTLVGLYRTVVTDRLPRILDAVDISAIVEQRINEMDVRESERLILQVMRRELKAIVWLGALLGFVMGCVNLLF
ncbi:MAG: DUF445 family protein [Clostridium sp.]|nr:DUF445 family protein [Clostridium sp.]